MLKIIAGALHFCYSQNKAQKDDANRMDPGADKRLALVTVESTPSCFCICTGAEQTGCTAELARVKNNQC